MQILHVTGTIVVNFKAQFKSAPTSDKEAMEQFSNIFYRNEKEWFKPIPPDLLTYERFKKGVRVHICNSAVTFLRVGVSFENTQWAGNC